jgi:16S rRNA G1207 methylase RsmC
MRKTGTQSIELKSVERYRQDLRFDVILRGEHLSLRSTWGLFSPKAVDEGTRLLLEHMTVGGADHCLDLGCGYGPIGLTLARCAPAGTTLMVDKDFVAVDYAQRNIVDNGITNAAAKLSNGFDQIGDRTFDLIASNLPAKTGKELYYLYFVDALARLRPDGRFYVVVITGLRRFIERAFLEVFGNYEKIKQGRQYTVALARKLDPHR